MFIDLPARVYDTSVGVYSAGGESNYLMSKIRYFFIDPIEIKNKDLSYALGSRPLSFEIKKLFGHKIAFFVFNWESNYLKSNSGHKIVLHVRVKLSYVQFYGHKIVYKWFHHWKLDIR